MEVTKEKKQKLYKLYLRQFTAAKCGTDLERNLPASLVGCTAMAMATVDAMSNDVLHSFSQFSVILAALLTGTDEEAQ